MDIVSKNKPKRSSKFRKNRLFWKLYPKYLLISVAGLAALFVFAFGTFRTFYFKKTSHDLESRLSLVAPSLIQITQSEDLNQFEKNSNQSQIQQKLEKLGRASDTRLTFIRKDGLVLGDTLELPERMDNHLGRTEVKEALKQGVGISVRHSNTIGRDFMYAAKPIHDNGELVGVIRAAVSFDTIQDSLKEVFMEFLIGAMIIAVAVAGMSWRISRNLTKPLEVMRNQARRMSKGDFSTRFQIEKGLPEEVELLGKTLNRISTQINQRIETILVQKGEIQAILSSMIEGVIAVDNEGKVLHLNETASELLGLDVETSKGQSIQNHLKNTDLEQFINQVMDSFFPIETEMELEGESWKSLQIHGSPLIGEKGERSGAVFVFNDITRLRQLENHRRDFVANVSHELRTPLTSIKGFVETLQEGAIEDPEASRKFLDIMGRHTNRLGAIIEDLLALSRLERDIEENEVELSNDKISNVVGAAVEICQVKAKSKDVRVVSEIDEGLKGLMNAPLLEQAIVNLVDNAIKYSEPGNKVLVKGVNAGEQVMISVRDYGCGIPKEHLPRLFERFYRVDKARSRKLGGTGLGLSIVKHIAIAHKGQVDVKSEVGDGSEFQFWIHTQPGSLTEHQNLN